MGSLRVSTQEAAQKITRKITMEAQNIGEEIERVSIPAGDIKHPILITSNRSS